MPVGQRKAPAVRGKNRPKFKVKYTVCYIYFFIIIKKIVEKRRKEAIEILIGKIKICLKYINNV